jgi:hypothetical protein
MARPNMTRLRLHVDLARHGGFGELDDSLSAIARPYRRLVEDGSDPGKISYVLLSSPQGEPSRIVGALCETPGERLLFFPGSRVRRLAALFQTRAASPKGLNGIVDHITFEKKNRRAHVTEIRSGGERKALLKLAKRREVGRSLYAWFGITLRAVTTLDSIPARLWFSAQCPSSDAERRLELFRIASRTSRVCSLPAPRPGSEGFLQINFFIGFDSGGEVGLPTTTFVPNGPPELRAAVQIPATINTKVHTLKLHGMGVVRIHASIWDGEPVSEAALGF